MPHRPRPPPVPVETVSDEVWEHRHARRQWRVRVAQERGPLVYLNNLGWLPAPPCCTDRTNPRPWESLYIRWRDDAVDLAGRMGYVQPS